MGQEFAFVFDIIVIATLIGLIFVGIKKGFARILIELISLTVSIVLAFFISEPITNAIYENFIEEPLENTIEEQIGGTVELVDIAPFGDTELDYGKIRISDVPVTDVEPNFEGTGAAVMDLSDVDFSESGIENLNLGLFGIKEDEDFSSVNAKTASFTMTEIDKYGLGKLVTAHYLATCTVKSPISVGMGAMIDAVKNALPMIFTDTGAESLSVSSVRTVILAMIDTKSSAKTALMDGIISPACIIIIRVIIVIILFTVFMAALSLIARGAGLINKIPVLGKVNSFLGGIAGLCEAAVIIVLICLLTRLIASIFSGNVILFNDTAINSTFLFKYIYNLDFLSFM